MNLAFGFVRKPILLRAFLRLVGRDRPDLVYSRGFGDAWEAIAAQMVSVPFIVEVNGDVIAERAAQLRRHFSPLHRMVLIQSARRGFELSRAIVAVTETLRRRLVEDFVLPREKIHVVGNAADTERFRPVAPSEARANLSLPPDVPIVLFVGNLAPWQGVDVLLSAFPQVLLSWPESILVVVGDGQEAPRLQQISERLGLRERVRFTGRMPHEEVPSYIGAADLCVAPMTRERLLSGSSAVKIFEYLACGRPVIASRIPGLEFLEREGIGTLVPPEDPSALADAISRSLGNPSWLSRAGHAAREYVLAHASWNSVVDQIEAICRTAIA